MLEFLDMGGAVSIRIADWTRPRVAATAWIAGWRERRHAAAEIAELQGFSDRDLRELRIGRGNLHAIVHGTYQAD